MAMSRYDLRRQLVVDEANAIGTTYLRAKMLAKPQSTEIPTLLLRYIDVRLIFSASSRDQPAFARADAEAERLHRALWSQAMAAVKSNPQPVPTGLFVQSLNEVIDDHAKRVAAMQNQVPALIFAVLYLVAIGAMGLTGFACGLAGRRSLVAALSASVLIALVAFAITDLDQPRRGLIRTSQQSLIDLRASINRDLASTHAR